MGMQEQINKQGIKDNLISKANYVIFPNANRYDFMEGFPEDVVKLPIIEGGQYGRYPLNQHHFTPEYHIQHALPIIAAVLRIPYDRNDFELREMYDRDYDISCLYPKKEFIFDLQGLSMPEELTNVSFDMVRTPQVIDVPSSKYHQTFRYSHRCGRIINKTIDSNRILVLSHDSQMIPDVPVLCCYFKEVWAFDNRDGKSTIGQLAGVSVTDVLIVAGYNALNKYVSVNLQ
jgi:hypothetical protein